MKERYISLFKSTVSRAGADELLEYISGTDFFTAPASTKFHLCKEGGLVTHSLHVEAQLDKIVLAEKLNYTPETIAICGLLHDLCKADFYTVEYRNRKNKNGVWEQYPFYAVKDKLPYGHGEKSVYLIEKYMRLTEEEAMAIRWHMGGFDDSSCSNAFAKYPLAVALHMADLAATYIDEREAENE